MVDGLLVARGVMSATGLVLLALAGWVSVNRDSQALRPFVALLAVVGAFATVDGVAAGNPTTLALVWTMAFVSIPLAFTWFVVEYYGLPHLASPARKVAFVLPAAIGVAGGAVLVLSPSVRGSMVGGLPSAPPLPSAMGAAAIAEQLGIYYAGGVMVAGVALLAGTVADHEYLDPRLAGVLAFVPVWPWVGYSLTPIIVTEVGLTVVVGVTAGGYVLSALATGFAVTRGGLFEAAPAAGTLGPETVLSELDDAVVVVDRDQQVVRLNEAAVETFGLDPGAATGRPLSACLDADLETLRAPDAIEVDLPEGLRYFEASVSPVVDRLDRQPGHAVVLTDVTRERVRSQRLSVLNRVLRHNLRNELNGIKGRAELIAEGDHEHTDTAERIASSADDLASMGDRAREVEEMMSITPDLDDEVALAGLVEAVFERYRSDHPDASLSVDVDESLTVSTDERILTDVLDNLVENALVHNDAPTPVVTVSARRVEDGDVVRVSVSDNGPGLPEGERAVIESGSESTLEHGSGLGLWAVKWGVVRLGGDLAFSDNEPEGTVVSIRLPRAPRSAPSQPVPVAAE